MPTGYEARQGGRNSFADEGIPPVQTSTGASADSRGAQQVGGESIGGAEGGQFTAPGAEAFGLGQFFERFMEPIVERKQQEKFFKGYTEAQSGRALEELTDNDSPLSQIFGPSGFAQGAQFYHAQSRIDQWTQTTLADADNLKRMAPAELAKYMAQTSQEMLTGDPYADQHIQVGLLEAQGPVIQTIAKERFKWQQNEMVEQQSGAAHASAGAFQAIAAANAALGESADIEAIQMAGQRFAGIMQKPDGMTDENYQKFLSGFLKRSMQEGNFYAVELLRSHGVTEVLTEDQSKAVDDAYERYGNRALSDAAATPDIMRKMLELEVNIDTGKVSVEDAVIEMRSINGTLSHLTGVDRPYYDEKAFIAAGGRVIDVVMQRANRAETRRWQIEDRQADLDRDAAEEAERIGGVHAAWATGEITAAQAMGGKKSDFEVVALDEYQSGNLTGIARAFVQSGWSSTAVASQAQAKARAGIGEKYTKSTDAAYQEWKAMRDVNPALATTYFGEYDPAFARFDMLVNGGVGPEVAFRDSFAKPGGYSAEGIPAAQRKEYGEALEEQLGTLEFALLNPTRWGNETPTPVARGEISRAIGDHFAVLASNSTRPPAELVKQAYQVALGNGRLEQYGEMAWANTRPGPKLGDLLHLKPRDAGAVITAAIRHQVEAIGVKDLDSVRVIRSGNNLVLETLVEGVPKYHTVTFDQLQRVAQGYVERRANRLVTGGFNQSAAVARGEAERRRADPNKAF